METSPKLDALALQGVVMGAKSVEGVRTALRLPPCLGRLETRFVRAATELLSHLSVCARTGEERPRGHFGESWVNGFERKLIALKAVLDSISSKAE